MHNHESKFDANFHGPKTNIKQKIPKREGVKCIDDIAQPMSSIRMKFREQTLLVKIQACLCLYGFYSKEYHIR